MGGRGRAPERVHRACRGMLRAAARLVPRPERRAWREEWEGELWALWAGGRSAGELVRYATEGLASGAGRRWEETMRGWVDDLRHGTRALARSPGFTATAVLVLALAVGATTSIFSVLHAALLESAPYRDAERLVMVDLLMGPPEPVAAGRVVDGVERLPFSWPRYEVVDDALETVELAGYTARDMTLLDAGDAARVRVEVVTPSYFPVLGADAALGRTLRPDEAPPAAAPVAVLSHAVWQGRFGASPDVLGRTVRLNGTPVSVVGVMPADFDGLTGDVDAWVSMALAPEVMDPRRLERLWAFWFYAVGRVPAEVSLERGAADVAAAGRAEEEVHPAGEGSRIGAGTRPFLEARVNADARLSVLVLSGASLLLLLIACANVTGLLVARAHARRHDAAVREALGAGRGRLLRGQLVESLGVAVLGGAVGVLLAYRGVAALAAGLPRAVGTTGANQLRFLDPDRLAVDGPVLLFALGASLATGLVAGVWPALRRRGSGPAASLTSARATGGGGGGAAARARGVLVAAQLALALVLLTGTGLMLDSLVGLGRIDLGVDPEGVLVGSYELPQGTSEAEIVAFHAALEERLAGLPGVGGAAVATCTPVSGRCDVTMVTGAGGTELPGEAQMPVSFHVVGDDYFRTVGIPLLEGRVFDARDGAADAPVAVLDRAAAEALFPDARRSGAPAVVGRRLNVAMGPLADGDGARVVGIVAGAQHDSRIAGDRLPSVYVSYRQLPVGYASLVVKGARDPRALIPGVQRELGRLRPDVPLYDVATLQSRIADATARTRVVLILLGLFAGTALLLSAVGLYGLMSFVVSRRVREMGVRIALGARPGRVVARVLGGAGRLVVAGTALGLAGSWGLTRLMEGLLYGVEPRDPGVLAGAAAVLAAIALVAAWLPARRAARVDPMEALRTE